MTTEVAAAGDEAHHLLGQSWSGSSLLLVLVRPGVAPSPRRCCSAAAMCLVYLVVRKYLPASAHERHHANKQRFQIAGEALGGIKDVKLLGLEDALPRPLPRAGAAGRPPRRGEHDRRARCRTTCSRRWPSAACSPSCSTCSITGNGSLGSIVPMLAVYAFAAIRIFPALQRIYTSLAHMRFSKPTLDRLHADMKAAEANMRTLPPRVDSRAGAAPDRAARARRRPLHLSARPTVRRCSGLEPGDPGAEHDRHRRRHRRRQDHGDRHHPRPAHARPGAAARRRRAGDRRRTCAPGSARSATCRSRSS